MFEFTDTYQTVIIQNRFIFVEINVASPGLDSLRVDPFGQGEFSANLIQKGGSGFEGFLSWEALGSQMRRVLRNLDRFGFQQNGRIYPRWFTDDHDAQPGTYTKEGFYECQWGRLMDQNPHYVLAVYYVYLKDGDKDQLLEHLPYAQRALDYCQERDVDDDGLMEDEEDGIAPRSSHWWDCIRFGHKDAYVNIYYYAALQAMAEMERVVGHDESARNYQRRAERCRRAYNRVFWSEEAGHYIGWIDREGKPHDAFYTFVNLEAIAFGLADAKRAKRILLNINNHPNAYRTFGVSSCLKPIPPSDYLPGTPGYGSQSDGNDGYGTYLNGGVAVSLIAFDILSRAEYEDGESAFEKYRRLMDQYEKDHLYGPNHNIYGFDGKGSGGEPYLTDDALAIWGFYQGVLGYRPSIDSVELKPALPSGWSYAFARKLRYLGDSIAIAHVKGKSFWGRDRTDLAEVSPKGMDFVVIEVNKSWIIAVGNPTDKEIAVRVVLETEAFQIDEERKELQVVLPPHGAHKWKIQRCAE